MTQIPYYLPSSSHAWSVVKVANVLYIFFDSFQKLCKGANHSAVLCSIYLLLTLKRCIHLKSSHGIDMQGQNHSQKRGCSDSTFLAKWLKEEIARSEMTYLTVTCCDHACLPHHNLCFSWKLDRCAKHNSGVNQYKGRELPLCHTLSSRQLPKSCCHYDPIWCHCHTHGKFM